MPSLKDLRKFCERDGYKLYKDTACELAEGTSKVFLRHNE